MEGAAIEDRESGDIEIPWKKLWKGRKTINGGGGEKKGGKSKRKEGGGQG